MRRLTQLQLQQIGDDLCVVFMSSDSRYRGILGAIDPDQLDGMAIELGAAARRYRERNVDSFQATFYEI